MTQPCPVYRRANQPPPVLSETPPFLVRDAGPFLGRFLCAIPAFYILSAHRAELLDGDVGGELVDHPDLVAQPAEPKR